MAPHTQMDSTLSQFMKPIYVCKCLIFQYSSCNIWSPTSVS